MLQVRSGPLTVLQDAGDEIAECESDGGLSIISTSPDPFVPSGLCFHFRLGNTRPSTRQLVHLQMPVLYAHTWIENAVYVGWLHI